tara:strand:- start:576 stop:791 length:216 start_codon:yes stop_codon:yes gene_type:complete
MKLNDISRKILLLLISIAPSLCIIEFTLNFLPSSGPFNLQGKASYEHYTFDSITGYALRKNIKDNLFNLNN